MRKIQGNHTNKDRILCVTGIGKHSFYYQPFASKEKIWLFDTKNFHGSVFVFWRKFGRCLEGESFSLTLKELYEKIDRRNPVLLKIMDHLAVMINDLLDSGCEKAYVSFTARKAVHQDDCLNEQDVAA